MKSDARGSASGPPLAKYPLCQDAGSNASLVNLNQPSLCQALPLFTEAG